MAGHAQVSDRTAPQKDNVALLANSGDHTHFQQQNVIAGPEHQATFKAATHNTSDVSTLGNAKLPPPHDVINGLSADGKSIAPPTNDKPIVATNTDAPKQTENPAPEAVKPASETVTYDKPVASVMGNDTKGSVTTTPVVDEAAPTRPPVGDAAPVAAAPVATDRPPAPTATSPVAQVEAPPHKDMAA